MSVPQLFDRQARRARRDSAGLAGGIIDELISEELLDRLDSVSRQFTAPLLIGASAHMLTGLAARGLKPTVLDAAPNRAAAAQGITGEEDALPFPAKNFDLVIAAGTFDTVADLPGALILARRVLKPDGLFLGCMVGSPSLPMLRQALTAADPAVRRLHPQVDPRAGGDLLSRAGFALPVADSTALNLSYRSLDSLIADLRASAATNMLAERQPFTRDAYDRAKAAFAAAGDGERTTETITLLTLTGWAPDASQPQPAKRGSATASLASTLGNRRL
jgi:SAM-dependent methyltransferase